MSNKLNNLVQQLTKVLKPNNNKSSRRRRKKMAKKKIIVMAKTQPKKQKMMPAAQTPKFERQFTVVSQNANSMRVRGRDLIYQIPDDLTATAQDTPVITVIPCNPAYWTGTRISALASGYQNYRPMSFTMNYIPQCAVTQQGNVIAGTLWNQAPAYQNLQQTLRTSNGGMLTQCYAKATSVITLKSNLQFNLFRMAGEFDQESNPFIFIALAVGCVDLSGRKINPGYFYVTYEFVFKNPIGNTISYFNSQLAPLNILPVPFTNVSMVNCKPFINPDNQDIPIGAILQDDYHQSGRVITYSGTEVLLPEDAKFWLFANTQIANASDVPELSRTINYLNKEVPTTGDSYYFTSANVPGAGKTYYIQEPGGKTEVYTLICKGTRDNPIPTTFDLIMGKGQSVYSMPNQTWVQRHYPAGDVQEYRADGTLYHGYLDEHINWVFEPFQ